MNWKTIVVVGLILGAILFAGTKFLLSGNSSKDQEALKTLLAQHGDLESRIAKIEKTLASLSKEIERSITMVESNRGRLDALAGGGVPQSGPPTPPMAMTNAPPPLPGRPMATAKTSQNTPSGDPAAWIDKLTEKKRQDVMGAFGRHAQAMREAIPSGTEGRIENPEELGDVMERENQVLKSELKGILTEEEYDLFLSSLPPAPQVRPDILGIPYNPTRK